MSIPAYDLIEISVGTHIVSARPIEWDGKDYDGGGNDADGKPINAVVYMTTCPVCAQLINFKHEEIYIALDKSERNIKCPSCGLGKDGASTPDDVHDLVVLLDEDSDTVYKNGTSTLFVDPILSGEFDIPIEVDLL